MRSSFWPFDWLITQGIICSIEHEQQLPAGPNFMHTAHDDYLGSMRVCIKLIVWRVKHRQDGDKITRD